MAEFYATYSHLINLIGVNALLALSIYITLSCAMLSLSNAASMGIGAYTAALLTTNAGWGLWPAVAAGAGVAGAVALLLGLPILRLRGVFLAIATIGFGEVVRVAIVNTPALGGAEGFRLNTGANTATSGFWEIYAALGLAIYFFSRLKGSRMGLALEAIREDENAARTMGINATFYKVAAYVLGAAIAGVAGALYAHALPVLLPGEFGFGRAVEILVYAVVGGTFAWRGALAGAFLMTVLSEVLRIVPPVGTISIKDYPEIFSGLILLGVILFMPNGLLSISLGFRRAQRKVVGSGRWSDHPEVEARPAVEGGAEQAAQSGQAVSGDRDAAGARGRTLLRVNGLSRAFGGLQAVNNVSFEIREGEIYGLIGPNGAGKTTVINILSGLLQPSAGSIEFDGVRLERLPAHRIAALGIARTYQNIRLFGGMTVGENVIVGQHARLRSTLAERLLLLPGVRREEERARRKAARLLSGLNLGGAGRYAAVALPYGSQRRLEMARALASDPRLLLLDEPAAGMNSAERAELQARLRSLAAVGLTILLIEHDVSLVMKLCDRIGVLNFGTLIAEGSPGQVAASPAVIEAYLGSEE